MVDCACGRKAVYSGSRLLCREHLSEWLQDVVKESLKKHTSPSDVLAVAVSGGKDSTTLLEMVHRVAKCKVFAVSVDAGIGGYSAAALKFIKGFCDDRGIEFHTLSFAGEFGCTLDGMLANRSGGQPRACTVCGSLRRYLINKRARELGATKVLFAHNLDDELQTFLMNLFSGNLAQVSRKGELVGIIDHPLFVVRLKPWIEVPEKALATYAFLNYPELPDGKCPNLRESARFEVRRFLNSLEARRPGAKKDMMSLYVEQLLPLLKPTGGGLHRRLRECKKCGEPSSRDMCKTCELRASLCPSGKS